MNNFLGECVLFDPMMSLLCHCNLCGQLEWQIFSRADILLLLHDYSYASPSAIAYPSSQHLNGEIFSSLFVQLLQWLKLNASPTEVALHHLNFGSPTPYLFN